VCSRASRQCWLRLGGAGNGEDGDVVGLGSAEAKCAGGFGDGVGGLGADGLGAVEAEELARGGASVLTA